MKKRLFKWLRRTGILFAGVLLLFVVLDAVFPLPGHQRDWSTVVVSANGTPLRAFPDRQGVWRYPVKISDVSPLYIEALLNYEDRWFWRHPGVNPLALLRAGWQSAWNGRVISGGSTITMQVARLIDPHQRTISGKFRQMFRALQLEYHYDKRQILTMYLNMAPFGGPLEGVQAASYAYFGKPARNLSHAEAALLAVLPQSPSRFRPDRNPQLARLARDKLIRRMVRFGIWEKQILKESRQEDVHAGYHGRPMQAPLLARRLKLQYPDRKVLQTTLDAELQSGMTDKLRLWQSRLPKKSSAAILVVDNRTLAVRAYVGSVDFSDRSRFGHVDMVMAIRSPGSTLKPFLYGLAIEDGLIHSKSLLVDVPQTIDGYRPGNFHGKFHGPVSVEYALQNSLNVPAVDLLSRYGVERFAAKLQNGRLSLRIPGDKPNLSVILGGAGTSLESLVASYTAFARNGVSGRLRYLQSDKPDEYRMLARGSAWIVRRMLETNLRPGLSARNMNIDKARQVAWKTGTSYGYRDAWAIGVTDRYTIGVWVGRPDGTPVPGHYGAVTAAPILFDIVDSLPGRQLWAAAGKRPATVSEAEICWPLGSLKKNTRKDWCHRTHKAMLYKHQVPPSLPESGQSSWASYKVSYWVNPATGKRVMAGCKVGTRERRETVRWPTALQPWLDKVIRLKSGMPDFDSSCHGVAIASSRGLKISGLETGTVLHRPGNKAGLDVSVTALGGEGELYWLVNGRMAARSRRLQAVSLSFPHAGRYEVTVADQRGHFDRVVVKVID